MWGRVEAVGAWGVLGCKGRVKVLHPGQGRELWSVGVGKETAARRFTLRCISMLFPPHSVHTSAPLQV